MGPAINTSQKLDQSRTRIRAALWAMHLIWRSHPHLMLGIATCTLILGIAPAGFALAIRGLINSVSTTISQTDASSDASIFWLLLALVVTITDSVTGLAMQLLSERLQSNLTLDVNTMVMEHASQLDLPYIENSEHRETLDRVRQDPGGKIHALLYHTQKSILSAVQVLSLAGLLAWLEPAVLLFAVVLGIPFFVFQWRLSRRRYLTEFNRSGKQRWTNYFLSRLTNPLHVGEVKMLGLGRLLTNRFVETMAEFRDQDQQLQFRQFLGSTVFVTITTLAFYALFGRVIIKVVSGELSIGDLAIFGAAVVRLRTALETGIKQVARAYEQTLYVVDLEGFLETVPMVEDRGSNTPEAVSGALDVENVFFAYPGSDEIILHDVSFHIDPGETVAIVGENGSGKSTLAKVLARLYEVDSGRILLDNRPLGDYPLDFLHGRVALMGQNFGRYEASIADNIAYGDWDRLSSNTDELLRLAALSGVDRIAANLLEGLDTKLGREFSEYDLSGGQWQLLAIARTLARNASVLILDEPTSNIDARAEHTLYATIEAAAKDVTTIIISHRFSSIRMADRIIVMDQGRIIEQGTHAELLSAGKHYANLFTLHEHYRIEKMEPS